MNWKWKRRKIKKEWVDIDALPQSELRVSETVKFEEEYVDKVPDLATERSMKLAFKSIHPTPYVEPTDKEMIEGLEECDNYEVAYRLRELKRENANLKRKVTILKKKYETV